MDVLPLILALVGGLTFTPADTMVVLGSRSVDLTGDGSVEVLEVVGEGEMMDSLQLTFRIRSADRVLYSQDLMPLSRAAGFDAGQRRLSEAEHRERLANYGDFFFADEKLQTPEDFIAMLRSSLPRHEGSIAEVIARDAGERRGTETGERVWAEIQERGATVFEFSPGGDGLIAIAWSESEQRFFRLIECC